MSFFVGKMFDVAIIMLNYNSNILTQKCIESCINKTSKNINYQIVVVDNCSEKEDFHLLKRFCESLEFQNLQLIRSDLNLGFGLGNMLGVHYSSSRYLAFVNNDTLFLNDCVSVLYEALQKDTTIGVVGAQPFNAEGRRMVAFDHFDSLVKEILGRYFLEMINSKKYPKRKKEYENPIKVNYVQGSFMLIRKENFDIIGGFDSNIFLYYEETDFCKRLEKINKSCYLIPTAHYLHYQGASTPKSIEIKKELKISLLYVIRKHYGFLSYSFLLNYLRIRYFFSSIFTFKNWTLFRLLLIGAPLSKSLKLKQKIVRL